MSLLKNKYLKMTICEQQQTLNPQSSAELILLNHIAHVLPEPEKNDHLINKTENLLGQFIIERCPINSLPSFSSNEAALLLEGLVKLANNEHEDQWRSAQAQLMLGNLR